MANVYYMVYCGCQNFPNKIYTMNFSYWKRHIVYILLEYIIELFVHF